MELTPGMRDPSKNHYLLMPVKDLRNEIHAMERTLYAVAGSVDPRLDTVYLDTSHRLRFARAAMQIRDEVA